MPTRVRFRFNKATGEIEEFVIDDQNRDLSEAEHDRIANEVGRFVSAHPRIREAVAATEARPGEVPPVAEAPSPSPPAEPTPARREGA